jgi:hypothetical protein
LKNSKAAVNDHSTSDYEFIGEEKYPGIVNRFENLKYLFPDEVKRLDDIEKVIKNHYYLSLPRQGTDIVFIFRKVDLLNTLKKRFYDSETNSALLKYIPEMHLDDLVFHWDVEEGYFE